MNTYLLTAPGINLIRPDTPVSWYDDSQAFMPVECRGSRMLSLVYQYHPHHVLRLEITPTTFYTHTHTHTHPHTPVPTMRMSAVLVMTGSWSGGVCSWQIVIVASPVPSLWRRAARANPVCEGVRV